VSKVPAVDQNRYHLRKANLAQFGPKFGTGKFFLFVFGQNHKSVEELSNGPVLSLVDLPRGTMRGTAVYILVNLAVLEYCRVDR
jgi:hypothetical protein